MPFSRLGLATLLAAIASVSALKNRYLCPTSQAPPTTLPDVLYDGTQPGEPVPSTMQPKLRRDGKTSVLVLIEVQAAWVWMGHVVEFPKAQSRVNSLSPKNPSFLFRALSGVRHGQ
jgi:hypothetical protein